MPGIHTPYLYFGSTFSTFPSHREDGNFLSVNIHYWGADKIWYVINGEDGVRFQKLINKILLEFFPQAGCTNLMIHELFVVTEQFLRKNKFHSTKIIQKPRTFVITHPFDIHGGFNMGFNINGSVNFANVESVKYFATYETCPCDVTVHLDGEKIIKEKYPTHVSAKEKKMTRSLGIRMIHKSKRKKNSKEIQICLSGETT